MSEEKEYDEKSPFLNGLMIGGILGAAFGVLASPILGEDLKKKLKGRLEEFDIEKSLDKLSKAIEAGTGEAKQVAEKISNEDK